MRKTDVTYGKTEIFLTHKELLNRQKKIHYKSGKQSETTIFCQIEEKVDGQLIKIKDILCISKVGNGLKNEPSFPSQWK